MKENERKKEGKKIFIFSSPIAYIVKVLTILKKKETKKAPGNRYSLRVVFSLLLFVSFFSFLNHWQNLYFSA